MNSSPNNGAQNLKQRTKQIGFELVPQQLMG